MVGGGIVGLATARELALTRGWRVTVLEKEPDWGAHQTGHNSGVIHAGLYYRPGSLKARMAVAGNASMTAYAKAAGVPVQVCGKLVVAVDETELPRLHKLAENAAANGVPAELIDSARAREYEPEVACVAALRVASTGIVDYGAVCRAFVAELGAHGAELRTGCRVTGVRATAAGVVVETESGHVHADALVNCAGLHSDRVARMAGLRPGARIVPFRGEYYELRPERRELVRGLIYPVPDPRFPFLGVHLTRMIDGSVHAGRTPYWRCAARATAAATCPCPTCSTRCATRAPGSWPAGTGGWAGTRCCARSRGPASPAAWPGWCPRSPPPTWFRPGPGCAHRR